MPSVKGDVLEARVQRLFFCQGAHAERSLLVRSMGPRSNLVTDVDVLAHDYRVNLHHTKIYAECKGGKRAPVLDRIVWVRGMMDFVRAAHGYLVLDRFDASSASHAKSCAVDLLCTETLESLESALQIDPDFWPGRSNLSAYAELDKAAATLAGQCMETASVNWAREAIQCAREFVPDEQLFSRLNSIIRILRSVREVPMSSDEQAIMQYLTSALAIRIAHAATVAAAETLNLTPSEREQQLADRFVFGGSDPILTRRIVDGALKLARAHVKDHGVSPAQSIDVSIMLGRPAYVAGFVELVNRLIAESGLARNVVLSMELDLFGASGTAPPPGFVESLVGARALAGTVRAFLIQSLGVPSELCGGMYSHLKGIVNPFVRSKILRTE